MKTKEAVLDALTRGKVKKAYTPGTFRKMKSRVENDQVTIGWMVDFLLKHNYTIRNEYNWMKPRVRKGEVSEELTTEKFGIEPQEPNADSKPIPLTWDNTTDLAQRCLTCLHPIEACMCGEANTTEVPIL